MEIITAEHLKNYEFFASLSEGALEALSGKVTRKEIPAGTEIIKEGDLADAFYIVCKGDLEITKKTKDGVTAKLASAREGDSFGEMALLTNMPRSCSVSAKTDVVLSAIRKADFDEIISYDTVFSNLLEKKAESHQEFTSLKTLQPLALIEPEKMLALIANMQEVKYMTGDNIIHQGEKGDTYYIIKEGKVAVYKSMEGKEPELVAELSSGSGFGEEAIIRDEPRSATVRALEDSTLLSLDKKTFSGIMQKSFIENAFPEDVIDEIDENTVILDARIPPEYREEHIKGAVNIPIEILRDKFSELNKSKKYYTYCTNDSRGMTAAFLMKSMGFNADAMRGGLSAWEGETVREDDGVHSPVPDA